MMGRPSIYSDAIADEICERIAEGESLRAICREDDKPRMATVFRWLTDERYGVFREQYTRAREEQAETLADEIVDISDGESPDADAQRDRLRVEARKWVASKLKPKKYGDKTLHGSDPENPLPTGFSVNLVRPSAD